MEQDGVHRLLPVAGVGSGTGSRLSEFLPARAFGSAPRGFSQLTMKLRRRGIGAALQQRPDRLRLAQADHGHRRPRLTLGQTIFFDFGGLG